MNFYRVTKTIRGRKYDYWQKTYRVGRSVKTLNKYIGPAGVKSGGGGRVASMKTHISIERLCGNLYRTFYIAKKDDKYFVQCTENSDLLWIDRPFNTPHEAASYAARVSEHVDRERAEEGRRERAAEHDLGVLEHTLSKMTPENQQSYLRMLTDNPEPGTISDLITPEFLARYKV